MIKRSVSIRGHRTSISLEAPFWDALQAIAAERGTSVAGLITEIDASRSRAIADGSEIGGLSSAIRIHILDYFRSSGATNIS